MSGSEPLFVTRLYRASLSGAAGKRLNRELDRACRVIAAEDRAGQAWCRKHGYAGYTSYASLDDLVVRSPEIGELARHLDRHVAMFARELDLELDRRKLALDSIWINILEPGGVHAAHIHPHSVVSGTYYVAVPRGAGAIRFEDPRLGLMMAAPPRKPGARRDNRTFVDVEPAPGTLLLWESWLRHEVPLNRARRERISISFNYGWR
jgi:uncharacterized protein (TIGR02466 family)